MTKSGITFEAGDIVLVPFPFTNMSQTKPRPVLILSNTAYNKSSLDFVCCGITSNLNNKDHSILLDPNDMEDGTIPKKSRIKFNKIFTLEKTLIIKKIGKVDSKILKSVNSALFSLFS